MLKEIFTQADEECLDSLLFDMRYKYALHITRFKEQLISKNSLTNFRTAVYRCNEEHVVDLVQEEIEASEDFKILSKMVGEHTQNVDGKVELKPSKEISPRSLQNPTDFGM